MFSDHRKKKSMLIMLYFEKDYIHMDVFVCVCIYTYTHICICTFRYKTSEKIHKKYCLPIHGSVLYFFDF